MAIVLDRLRTWFAAQQAVKKDVLILLLYSLILISGTISSECITL